MTDLLGNGNNGTISGATWTNSTWRDVIYKGNDNYYLMAMSNNSSRPVGGAILGGVYAEAIGPNALTVNTWAHLGAMRLVQFFWLAGAWSGSKP